MSFFTAVKAWIEARRLGHHHKSLARSHHDIATVRYSAVKPPKVAGRSLTLFYRPRTLWFAAQIVFFAALAFWTVKNYVHVLKSF